MWPMRSATRSGEASARTFHTTDEGLQEPACQKRNRCGASVRAAAAEILRKLLGFQSKINLVFAVLDFDVLAHCPRLSVSSLDLVFARRDVADLESAVLCRDGEIGMIVDASPGEHPGVNVTLKFQ